MGEITIVGIGNEFRQDDGVGPWIIQQLQQRCLENSKLLIQGGEGAGLIDILQNSSDVIFIDAVSSDAEPGTRHYFDARQSTVPAGFFKYSTHAFSVAEAIEMSRVLGMLPKTLRVYGVEGKNFSHGCGLSPEVEATASLIVEEIMDIIAAFKVV